MSKDPFEGMRRISNLINEIKSPITEFNKQMNEVYDLISAPSRAFKRIAENLPDYIKDNEKREELTKDIIKFASNKGWTFSEIIPIHTIINPEILDMDEEALNNFFMAVYDEDIFEGVKEHTIDEVSEKQSPLLKEVYSSVENNKLKIAIPSLILIIEGEISDITENGAWGYPLIKDWKKKLEKGEFKEEDELFHAKCLALTNFLAKHLFTGHSFNDERKPFINRNWVMHGRDNSELWTKVEVFKLINFLETLVEIKQEMDLKRRDLY